MAHLAKYVKTFQPKTTGSTYVFEESWVFLNLLQQRRAQHWQSPASSQGIWRSLFQSFSLCQVILRRVQRKQRSILNWVLSESRVLNISKYLTLRMGGLKKQQSFVSARRGGCLVIFVVLSVLVSRFRNTFTVVLSVFYYSHRVALSENCLNSSKVVYVQLGTLQFSCQLPADILLFYQYPIY